MTRIPNIYRYNDNDEFIKIRKQIENNFSIESEETTIYSYGNEHIICIKNSWFALLYVDVKFYKGNISNLKYIDYKNNILKVLHKILKETVFLDSLKNNKEINILEKNNKGILYCNYSQIIKLLS